MSHKCTRETSISHSLPNSQIFSSTYFKRLVLVDVRRGLLTYQATLRM